MSRDNPNPIFTVLGWLVITLMILVVWLGPPVLTILIAFWIISLLTG